MERAGARTVEHDGVGPLVEVEREVVARLAAARLLLERLLGQHQTARGGVEWGCLLNT